MLDVGNQAFEGSYDWQRADQLLGAHWSHLGVKMCVFLAASVLGAPAMRDLAILSRWHRAGSAAPRVMGAHALLSCR